MPSIPPGRTARAGVGEYSADGGYGEDVGGESGVVRKCVESSAVI